MFSHEALRLTDRSLSGNESSLTRSEERPRGCVQCSCAVNGKLLIPSLAAKVFSQTQVRCVSMTQSVHVPLVVLWAQRPLSCVISVFSCMCYSDLLVQASDPVVPDCCALLFPSVIRRLLGIITKKDILKHMAQIANRDPESILFNWAPRQPFTPSLCRPGEREDTSLYNWMKRSFIASTYTGCLEKAE